MTTLASLPGWDAAVGRLLALNDAHGAVARTRAQRYAETYAGRRAAMVFDVVASRQRDYLKRVLPMVARFEQAEESTLRGLSVEGVRGTYGLRVGEAETMRAVASGLTRYCDERGVDEEAGVLSWALEAEPFVHASQIEPYVGMIKDIGPALFAYLRMRSGANAIKPDILVRAGLVGLGLDLPMDDHAMLVITATLSEQTGIRLLERDHLLWWQRENEEEQGIRN